MPDKITRLTLFPSSGKRVYQIISNYSYTANGILSYTDLKGIEYKTTLRFALEFIKEGHPEAPFHEGTK